MYRHLWRTAAAIKGPAHGLRLSRNLFGGVKLVKESQSKVLGDVASQVYELQVHDIQPQSMGKYLQETEEAMKKVSSMNIPFELCGSWTTDVGTNLDQAVHLFKYKGGYTAMDECTGTLRTNTDWNNYQKSIGQMVTKRSKQILCAFTFWDPLALEIRTPRGMYELRSYTLKPGALIEWGQMWREGIQFRKKEEAVGGWFSQIGELHVVHHLWVYCNYMDRHETRQAAWGLPGWDECVLRTVPLVRHMESKILRPIDFSPLQ